MSIEKAIRQKRFANPYHRVLVNIIYTSNWLMHKHIEMLRPFGISPQQYNVLRILRGAYPEPLRLQDVRARMLDQTSNTSRLINKLAVKKMVEKETQEDDRRAVDIVITESGLELLKKTDPLIQSLEVLIEHLSPEDAADFSFTLDSIRSREEEYTKKILNQNNQ